MKNKDKLIEEIKQGFQANKGKGSIYCFTKEIIPDIVFNMIISFKKKHTNESILVVTDNYNRRLDIINRFNKVEADYIKTLNVTIMSSDYVNTKYRYRYKFIIIIGVNDDLFKIEHLSWDSTFMFCILTKNNMNFDFINGVRKLMPEIKTTVSDASIKSDNIYSPVEEHIYGVSMSDDDRELYLKYTDYINTCISIFGDLSNIEKCKHGDDKLNISSTEFRHTLAKENGWNEHLDTSIDYHKQIDDIYNPNILFERACNFYTISKQRRDLVSDNEAKLEIIKNICDTNRDKRIVIISKRGEYAAKVTNYLNSVGISCGDYHDCIDDKMAVDDEGNPILVKSGSKKGLPKVIGSQAISTLNMRWFNEGQINVLSIKNSSNVKLKIACDLIIFTSTMCESIIDIKKRFTNIDFIGIPTITYRIYCNGTIESDKLNKAVSNNIKIIDENENFIQYDENSNSIIL